MTVPPECYVDGCPCRRMESAQAQASDRRIHSIHVCKDSVHFRIETDVEK